MAPDHAAQGRCPRLADGGQDLGEQAGWGTRTSVRRARMARRGGGTARRRPDAQAALDAAARRRIEGGGALGRGWAGVGDLVTPHGLLPVGLGGGPPAGAGEPVQPHLGRRDRDVQLVGDGVMGQVVDVPQGPATTARREPAQRVRQVVAQAVASARATGSKVDAVVGHGALLDQLVDGACPLAEEGAGALAVIRYSQV